MTLLRVFIAVEIPLDTRKVILEETRLLRSAVGSLIRWVPLENMHLTLKFIGEVSPTSVDLLTQMLTAEVKGCPAFQAQVGSLGAFPSARRARVIWVGIQAPPRLASLQHGIEGAAARLGFEAETRPFSPHLTIGRVRQQASSGELGQIRTALEATRVGDLGTVNVDAIHLFKSDLQPGGAVYTRLLSAALENETDPERVI